MREEWSERRGRKKWGMTDERRYGIEKDEEEKTGRKSKEMKE